MATKDPAEIQRIKNESFQFRKDYANNMQLTLDALEANMKENN